MSKIDSKLLDILVCPVNKVALTPLTATELQQLNQLIREQAVLNVDGHAVTAVLQSALQTLDGKVIYPVQDGIMRLLPEEGIGTTQFSQWNRK